MLLDLYKIKSEATLCSNIFLHNYRFPFVIFCELHEVFASLPVRKVTVGSA